MEPFIPETTGSGADVEKSKTGVKIATRIAIGCAALIVLAIVAVASLIGFISLKKSKYDKVAVPFIESYIVELSSWEPERVRQYWAPEVLAQMEPETTERMFLAYRQLGSLQSYDSPVFIGVSAHTKIPYSALVTYRVSARFDAGQAVLIFQLVPTESEGLKVWHVNIHSEAFLPPLTSPTDTPEVEQTPVE